MDMDCPDPAARDESEKLATHDALIGRPSHSLWDLFRAEDHTPPNGADLFTASARQQRPMLGWDPETDEPIPWGSAGHLGIHGPAERVVQMDHMGLLVAVQLQRRYGHDAVTVIDANPVTADEDEDRWAPLRDAGMRVCSVVEDPGRAAAALAAVADTARARAHDDARVQSTDVLHYLVILGLDTLVPLLGAYSPGYAAAGRDVLRTVLWAPPSRGVAAVATTTSPPGVAYPGWSELQAPAPGVHEWTYRTRSRNEGTPVEVPQVVPTWWLAERLVAEDTPPCRHELTRHNTRGGPSGPPRRPHQRR